MGKHADPETIDLSLPPLEASIRAADEILAFFPVEQGRGLRADVRQEVWAETEDGRVAIREDLLAPGVCDELTGSIYDSLGVDPSKGKALEYIPFGIASGVPGEVTRLRFAAAVAKEAASLGYDRETSTEDLCTVARTLATGIEDIRKLAFADSKFQNSDGRSLIEVPKKQLLDAALREITRREGRGDYLSRGVLEWLAERTGADLFTDSGDLRGNVIAEERDPDAPVRVAQRTNSQPGLGRMLYIHDPTHARPSSGGTPDGYLPVHRGNNSNQRHTGSWF